MRDGAARILGATALLTLFLGCGGPAAAPAPTPPAVTVDVPERRDVTLFAEFTGTARAFESVEVRARVSGELEGVLFQPSAFVRKGEPLFRIEPRPYRAARDEATAALDSARAELERAEADLGRLEIAVQTDAVSQSDVDLARAQRNKAQASVAAAEARLDRAELEFSYTTARSPIDGQVGRNLVDVGNLVSAQSSTLLTTVNRLQPIHVYFDAPEKVLLQALGEIRRERGEVIEPGDGDDESVAEDELEGREAFVATLADEGFPHRAEIDYVDNTVTAETGTIQLRARLPNEGLALFPGVFVRVRVPYRVLPDAILVDERAVGTDLGGPFVYVVGEGDVVEQRTVELGPVQEDGMVPILSGLDGAERYVRVGILRARPGLPVSPESGAD